MKIYRFDRFGLDALRLVETADEPSPLAPDQVRVAIEALSLNYRDLLVIEGTYSSRLPLPATPLSDAAGVVLEVGPGVTKFRAGDEVMTHFVAGWQSGPFEGRFAATTLGLPGPGVAAEVVELPATALLHKPRNLSFAQSATLPIAGLTAWSALVNEGAVRAGQTVLTLGTGGVSLFSVQFAKALGARVIVTSSSDEKLERARLLGADEGINYREQPRWDKVVLELTDGLGADIVVENAGAATLSQSLKCARAGGVVALLGALTGLSHEINIAPIVMKRLRVQGILVDSRSTFETMVEFLDAHPIEPVIDREFEFEALPEALAFMKRGAHFGKIVIDVPSNRTSS